jgi:hypothetical protein
LKIINSPNCIQFQCRTLDKLKSDLDNIIHIGHDLGLYGFSLGIKSLRDHLKSTNAFMTISNPSEKELYDKIMNKLDWLINNPLKEILENRQIHFSDKVLKVAEYIKRNSDGQTIVFVERVFTAAFLCQVLREIFGNSMKVKYLAGSKAGIDGESVSAKYQVRKYFIFFSSSFD